LIASWQARQLKIFEGVGVTGITGALLALGIILMFSLYVANIPIPDFLIYFTVAMGILFTLALLFGSTARDKFKIRL